MKGLFGQNESPYATELSGVFAKIAPEQGLDAPDGLTYAVPKNMTDLRIGDRVIIPLGRANKKVTGYVLDISNDCAFNTAKIKSIIERDPLSINLPDELIDLAKWMADYYCCPLGMVLVTMLPAAVKRGTGLKRIWHADLTSPITPDQLPDLIKQHKLPPQQRNILTKAIELKQNDKLPMPLIDLALAGGAKTIASVKKLIEKNLLTQIEHHEVRAGWEKLTADQIEKPKDIQPNDQQQKAIDKITSQAATGFGVHLLHGVTGSGKTEIYLRAIAPVIARGDSAIMLVPEIALTPQTAARFIGKFGDIVAVLHSGLTPSQRHEQWKRIRLGELKVIVGARSAVFAPAQKLGLIIVDEEHDTSYKQDQLPRYHGRDVAIKRAQLQKIPLVLGSATPSLESYYNATHRNAYHLLTLPKRVANQAMPAIEIVDLTEERQKRYQYTGQAGVHLLSMRLETALRQTFKAGAQAMLLLNRRGYANYIACPDHRCGWTMQCDHCDVKMVYHLSKNIPSGGYVRCHYCTFQNRLHKICPVCGKKVTVFGLGTQRVEEEITRKFPDISMLRVDSDTMSNVRQYQNTLDQFRNGEVQLLVGTQVIAKGLDFPNVQLVGIINADTALNLPDFRASERTFQLITQVAGRSGRSDKGGRVLVQTFNPHNPAIELACQHDYYSFADQELAMRKQFNLPPITRMARIVIRDTDADRCEQKAKQTEAQLRVLDQQYQTQATISPAMPPPINRIASFHRQHIELTCPNVQTLLQLIRQGRLTGILRSDAHMAIDVDPVSLL